MPEYLAPGVYVEETSFRAKSIEGVGTSTTAFVGPTRKGPLATADGTDKPEMLTSFGDFARIYGGLEPLDFAPGKPNYLANAVLGFFNEGGARLYVARVANAATRAVSRLAGADGASARVHLRARYAGASGNGRILVQEQLTPAMKKAMVAAPAGTLVRAGGATPASGARIIGGSGPFALPNGGKLKLTVGGAAKEFIFTGTNATLTAAAPLADPVPVAGPLQLELDGKALTIPFAAGNLPVSDFLSQLNANLPGGFAALSATNALILGSDTKGTASAVKVVNAAFGFAAGATSAAATGNVANLAAVTVAEIASVLAAVAGSGITASPTAPLTITTTATGATASLAVNSAPAAGEVLVDGPLGLGAVIPGAGGSSRKMYAKLGVTWTAADASTLDLSTTADNAQPTGAADFVRLAATVEDGDGGTTTFDELSFDKALPRFVGKVLPETPTLRAEALLNACWFDIGADVSALQLRNILFSSGTPGGNELEGLSATYSIGSSAGATAGTDGSEPALGAPTEAGTYAAALAQLLGLEDVSIVAAPGHSDYACYHEVQGALIAHAEKPRAYRVAVLDTPPDLLPGGAREERARIDSTYGALYYPWVTVANPLARPGGTAPKEINLPPSGFLTGIYARNDVEHGVAKAPANEVVRSALRFANDINFGQNQLLNPLGVNCLRFFPGRGYRVWGARTVSSDPEWKYINVRRYFVYLESSIDRGTQWAVFENNGERLWANIRETIEAFLYNEWVSGNLLGASTKEAYFVRCDRSTMTQNDLDNGRLICLVGVAALKPAEFVIFRIGQKTADART
jgi:phage tail sheath protein FI